MFFIQRVKYPRHIFVQSMKVSGLTPDFTFWKYRIFKLKIIARLTDPEKGEQVYLALNDDETEKCIVYITLDAPGLIEQVRYWRTENLDGEISWYLVKGVVNEVRYKESINLKESKFRF